LSQLSLPGKSLIEPSRSTGNFRNLLLSFGCHFHFGVSSMKSIFRAYQHASVRFNVAGKIFASCNVFDGRVILSEYIKLVLTISIGMVIERLLADDARYSLGPVPCPERDCIPRVVVSFFPSRK
jgi:hypothetical protein